MKNKQTHSPFEQSLLDASQGTIITKDTSNITISCFMTLPASMSVFIGHFPQQPIFPAVMQLTFVRLLCSKITQQKLHNFSVGKTKFSGIIRPEKEIKIEIELSEKLHEYIAKFKFFNSDSLASSGEVTYKVTN